MSPYDLAVYMITSDMILYISVSNIMDVYHFFQVKNFTKVSCFLPSSLLLKCWTEECGFTICHCNRWWICRPRSCSDTLWCIISGMPWKYVLVEIWPSYNFLLAVMVTVDIFHQFNIFLQVVVLESRDRIGGRVHTDYSFGFPVDLGASW